MEYNGIIWLSIVLKLKKVRVFIILVIEIEVLVVCMVDLELKNFWGGFKEYFFLRGGIWSLFLVLVILLFECNMNDFFRERERVRIFEFFGIFVWVCCLIVVYSFIIIINYIIEWIMNFCEFVFCFVIFKYYFY